jgi:hypothetical protein
MVDNMVHADQFEKTLTKFFPVVYQYWYSGNFKGYAASDSRQTAGRLLAALGDVNSKFSTTRVPRRVDPQMEEGFMTYREWLKDNPHGIQQIVLTVVPPERERVDLTLRAIKEKFGAKILQAAQEIGLDLQEEELVEILDQVLGVKEMPPFDISHYNYHC